MPGFPVLSDSPLEIFCNVSWYCRRRCFGCFCTGRGRCLAPHLIAVHGTLWINCFSFFGYQQLQHHFFIWISPLTKPRDDFSPTMQVIYNRMLANVSLRKIFFFSTLVLSVHPFPAAFAPSRALFSDAFELWNVDERLKSHQTAKYGFWLGHNPRCSNIRNRSALW